MTKKQILKVLKENLEWQNYTDGNDSWDSELKEAVTEAIKLLEQPTSDDCIAREPLIKNWKCCADMLTDEGDSEIVMSWILDAPPVTPTFPKNATNGDMIKAMFPDLEIANDGLINDNLTGIIAFYGGYNTSLPRGDNYFNRKWWNAPYEEKRGNSDDSN